MPERSGEGWNAASGYLAIIALGIAGAAFERGSPASTAPIDEVVALLDLPAAADRAKLLMFVLSARAYLWFYGSLRSVLMRAEGGAGTLSTTAFGAGILSAGLQMILQCFQAALAVHRLARLNAARWPSSETSSGRCSLIEPPAMVHVVLFGRVPGARRHDAWPGREEGAPRALAKRPRMVFTPSRCSV